MLLVGSEGAGPLLTPPCAGLTAIELAGPGHPTSWRTVLCDGAVGPAGPSQTAPPTPSAALLERLQGRGAQAPPLVRLPPSTGGLGVPLPPYTQLLESEPCVGLQPQGPGPPVPTFFGTGFCSRATRTPFQTACWEGRTHWGQGGRGRPAALPSRPLPRGEHAHSAATRMASQARPSGTPGELAGALAASAGMGRREWLVSRRQLCALTFPASSASPAPHGDTSAVALSSPEG